MKRAVPLDLIANELVTNAMKYAFPEGTKGTITIGLSLAGGSIALEIADDGAGIPAGPGAGNSEGLGMTIVDLLAGQIGATLYRDPGKGTRIRLTLPA